MKNVQTSLLINNILESLIVGGMVGSIIIAPNAVQLAGPALKFLDKRKRKLKATQTLRYMRQKQLINYTELPSGRLKVTLMRKGRERIEKLDFEKLKIPIPKRWDKKWRLVMFDIPEAKRKSRSALSVKLKQLGFYQLQKSVWIHPYSCDREIELTKAVYGISENDIILAELRTIDCQNQLLKYFKIRD